MKTNPIGVRFKVELIEVLRKKKLCDTHQSVLSFLESYYIEGEEGKRQRVREGKALQDRAEGIRKVKNNKK